MTSSPLPQGSGHRPARISRRRLPFWALQTAELAIALILVDVSVHINRAGLLVAAAAALGILALSARGPLGVLRVCSQRTHVRLCVPVGALLLVAPVLPAVRPGTAGIVTVVLAMLAFLRLATITLADPRPAKAAAGGAWPGQLIDASATVSGAGVTADPTDPARVRDAAGAGNEHPQAAAAPTAATGDGGARSGRPTGSAVSSSDRLARLAGEAIATGQKAARQHRPAVEAGAKRGIRSLGRAVGRITSATPPPKTPPSRPDDTSG